MNRPANAFSLVELSIVLVILGLLVGGILAGQSLIHASELRAVGSEYQRYLTATQAFRDKYFAIPGDMGNAVSFWGTDPGGCTVSTDLTLKTATCNGSADGVLSSYESFRFWQHLANAGLIEGQYSGVAGAGGTFDAIIGNNVPASKFSGAQWGARYQDVTSGTSRFWGNYRNHFQIGQKSPGTWNDTGIFTPQDAWNMDNKLDDGTAANGIMVANATTTCTTGGPTNYNATYNLSANTQTCFVHFLWEALRH